MPLVSILLVFHRPSPFLEPAVRSLLSQTLDDLEVLLVDNGTGTGPQVLADFGRDPRLRLVSLSENQGCSAGYRAALKHARGRYVGLQSYDDVSLPRRLEAQVARLQRDSRLGLVHSRARIIDHQGKEIGREFALLGENECRVFSNYSNTGPAPSFLGRAEAFSQFPFRSELDMAEDFDFVARVADCWQVAGVDEDLLLYRRHPGQLTQSRMPDQILRACVVRLLTARRRNGRDEGLAATVASLGDWLHAPPPPAVAYEYFSRRFLSEGFALQAVYHARRMMAERGGLRTLASALRVLASALRSDPRHAVLLSRLFFTGPLRAHHLRPA